MGNDSAGLYIVAATDYKSRGNGSDEAAVVLLLRWSIQEIAW